MRFARGENAVNTLLTSFFRLTRMDVAVRRKVGGAPEAEEQASANSVSVV
jgi:hypothetical protein